MRWTTSVLILVACFVGQLPQAEADEAQKLFKQGKRDYLMADFEKAQGILSEAIKKAPPGSALKAKIHVYLALCHGEAKKDFEATAEFVRALVINPNICPKPPIKPRFIKLCLDQRGRMKGTLSVLANLPKFQILIDGKEVKRRLLKLPIGDHQVVVKSPNGQQQEKKVVIRAGKKVTRVSFTFRLPSAPASQKKPLVTKKPGSKSKQKRKSKRIWTWVAAGVAGGALVAGSVLQGTARSKFADWEEGAAQAHLSAAEANRLNTLAGDIDREQTASWIMFGVAGAAAVGAVFAFFLERPTVESPTSTKKPSRSRLQLTPVIGRNPGVLLRFEF